MTVPWDTVWSLCVFIVGANLVAYSRGLIGGILKDRADYESKEQRLFVQVVGTIVGLAIGFGGIIVCAIGLKQLNLVFG